MNRFERHIVSIEIAVKDALERLNELSSDAIVFLVDHENRLIGSLTDGDLRRGFISGLGLDHHLSHFIQPNPKYIQKGNYNLKEIVSLRDNFYNILPVVNSQMQIINVVNFRHQKSFLPFDALIMAGGRGERLKPWTDNTPKPLLKIGDKPIIEYNLDRLSDFGVDSVWISVRYLGDQLVNYFKDGSQKNLRIKYVWEEEALGTAAALALVEDFLHDDILLMNSDLLTNIDFEDFFLFYQEQEADLAVACIPYQVNIPYAVMDTENHLVTGLKEKPTYTHYSNGGIYLMKKEVIEMIPKNQFYNATDLIEKLIRNGRKVVSYPLVGYWLDIGKHDDFLKAEQDIKKIKF
jgi:dTDP-glucose pyrophosphorylase